MHVSRTAYQCEITSIVPERAQDYAGDPGLPVDVQSAWTGANRVDDSSNLAATWVTVKDATGRERLELRWYLKSITIRAEQPAA
jgi:hypothetical protein